MLLYFYFELWFPLVLAMRQARFRVARISFYIRDYTFYLSSLQISDLTVSKTTFPQFDNIACDRPAIWQKVQVKRRFPNKLGTCNHNFGKFPWHHNSIFLKIIAHDHGNTSQQQSWLTETQWEFEPLISSLTTISRIPIQLRNSPAFAFLALFRLIFGIFSLSTMVMSIFWYSNTSILLLCNS